MAEQCFPHSVHTDLTGRASLAKGHDLRQ
jgi:hypothetical protein